MKVFVPYRGLFNFNIYSLNTFKTMFNVFVPYRGLFNFNSQWKRGLLELGLCFRPLSGSF